MKSIGFYHFADVPVPRLFDENCLRVDSICLVDPYPALNPVWEKDISRHTKISQTRLVWSSLDRIHNYDLRNMFESSLPYASQYTIESLVSVSIPFEAALPDIVITRVLENSKRTIFGGIPKPNLENIINTIALFWFKYLLYSSTVAFFSSIVPHSFVDLILAECCKYLGLPFICQVTTGMDRHCFHLDYTKQEYLCSKFKSIDSERDLIQFISSCGNSNSTFRSSYSPAINVLAHSGIQNYKRKLMDGGEVQQSILNYKVSLARAYDHICRNQESFEGITGGVHYFFLHYQPEMTTSPLALNLSDQRNILRYILEAIDPNDIILIKEHPRQFIDCGLIEGKPDHVQRCLEFRTPDYYIDLVSNNRCYLVPRVTTNSSILRTRGATFWSATGTVNLQAFLHGHSIGYLPTLSPFFMLFNHSGVPDQDRSLFAFSEISKYLFPLVRGESLKAIYLDKSSLIPLLVQVFNQYL